MGGRQNFKGSYSLRFSAVKKYRPKNFVKKVSGFWLITLWRDLMTVTRKSDGFLFLSELTNSGILSFFLNRSLNGCSTSCLKENESVQRVHWNTREKPKKQTLAYSPWSISYYAHHLTTKYCVIIYVFCQRFSVIEKGPFSFPICVATF